MKRVIKFVNYLHRITIDDHGRSRFFKPQGTDASSPRPELPVNLHFLLIANANSATIEADLMSWAMVELANHSQLDISHLQTTDEDWGQTEVLNITPVDLTTEHIQPFLIIAASSPWFGVTRS